MNAVLKLDRNYALVMTGYLAGQTRQVLDKLDAYPKETGLDRTRVVSATVYVSDLGEDTLRTLAIGLRCLLLERNQE